MKSLPRVMVLQFEPQLTHSVWIDFYHRKQSMGSLLRCLRSEIKAGHYAGYRLMTVHKTVYGLECARGKGSAVKAGKEGGK